MAITNEMIVFNAQQQLLEQGKIKPTGRMVKIITADGVQEVPEAEEIHTFQHWKECGYQVRKGEHAVAAFSIWKYTSKAKGKSVEEAQQANEEDNGGFCFMKKAFWFSASQVDPIVKTA